MIDEAVSSWEADDEVPTPDQEVAILAGVVRTPGGGVEDRGTRVLSGAGEGHLVPELGLPETTMGART
jgi:hypothetical protein